MPATAPMSAQTTKNEQKKKNRPRVIATGLVGLIALILYIVWQPTTPASQAVVSTQYTPGSKILTPGPTDTLSDTGGNIQVYIIGAVQHPGVYKLAENARVYELVQAAGGALSSANAAVVNMAARLNDGQEIYIPHMGETPIAAMSGTTNSSNQAALVNVNTASTDQLRQSLSLSSKSAQDIVNYRLQHGPFSSVNALAQVVSKTIYDKIKDKVTV